MYLDDPYFTGPRTQPEKLRPDTIRWWETAPVHFCSRCEEDVPTYVIESADDVIFDRPQIVLGVPLCGSCEYPIEDVA